MGKKNKKQSSDKGADGDNKPSTSQGASAQQQQQQTQQQKPDQQKKPQQSQGQKQDQKTGPQQKPDPKQGKSGPQTQKSDRQPEQKQQGTAPQQKQQTQQKSGAQKQQVEKQQSWGQQKQQSGPPIKQQSVEAKQPWGPPGFATQRPQAGQQAQQPGPSMQQQTWGPPGFATQRPQAGQQAQQPGPSMQQQTWGPPGLATQRPQGGQQAQQPGPPVQQMPQQPWGQQGHQPGPPRQQMQQQPWGQQGHQPGPPMQQMQQQPRGQQGQQPGPSKQQRGGSQKQSAPQRGEPTQQGDPRQQQQQKKSSQADSQRQPQRGAQQQQGRKPSDGSVQSVEKSFHSMALSPSRLARGTAGKRDTFNVNYLELNLKGMPNVAYHYDVEINPETPKKFLRTAFETFCKTILPNYALAFDGRRSCYCVNRLPKQEISAKVEVQDAGNRIKEFTVTIKETKDPEVDLDSLRRYSNDRVYDKPMRALQVLEVVLANSFHNLGKRVGRSFFIKPDRSYDLTGGYEMYTGLYQAAILGDRPFLNVDIAHKSFPSECTIIEYLQRNTRHNDLNSLLERWTFNDVWNYLRGMNVEYVPPACMQSFPKTYKVNAILDKSAAEQTFKLEDKSVISVEKYYADKGCRLKYPKLNLLHLGSSVKTIYIPMEFCRIPANQALNKKDGTNQVQKMIRYAATSTNERRVKIMDLLGKFYRNQNDPVIRSFCVSVGSNFIQVPMRLLDVPLMRYANGTARPNNGSWWIPDNDKFLITMPKNKPEYKWTIIYSKQSRLNYHKLNEFGDCLLQEARSKNVPLANKIDVQTFDNISNKLRDLSGNFDLVIVVIPFRGTTYADIKQQAELKIGILTQCIKEETLDRKHRDKQVALNLLLKINSKLNGTNHKIDDRSERKLGKVAGAGDVRKVMFLGADVTHPPPDQKDVPSVVGVAASHDKFGVNYNMQYRLQQSALETIQDMKGIVEHHLRVYFQHQNSYPSQIIYYRDGVSDGQFPHIRDQEILGIRQACATFKIKVLITCLIVVKRHHTRFFPRGEPNPRNKFNNCAPGTVVDEVITHPNEIQFFMVSHQSIQGTAKPTRYNVLLDESEINIDDLQALTYYLCHVFPRCNRAVSYPAPAYLAHLVAFRGRVYLEGTRRYDKDLNAEYKRHLIKPDWQAHHPMFFV